MLFESPSIDKVLDVSTAHVLQSDVSLLNRDDSPLVAYEYQEGFFLSSHLGDEDCNLDSLRKWGFSDAFLNIFDYARTNDIRWINLDSAGMVYEELPVFEW